MSDLIALPVSAILLIFILHLWKDFWIDEFRNDLFAVRDDLFDYAARNDLLDHRAYRLMRARG